MQSQLHYNNDSKFWQFWSFMGHLVTANLLFIVTCLPIFTIGASSSALYSVMFKLRQNRDTEIVREYFQSFKLTFKRSTLLWLPLLFFGVVTTFCIRLITVLYYENLKYSLVLFAVLIFFALIIWLYVFPLQSVYEGSCAELVAASIKIGVARFPWTLSAMVLSASAATASLYNALTIMMSAAVWILFGFSLIAYTKSFFFIKAFEPWIASNKSSNEVDIEAKNLLLPK